MIKVIYNLWNLSLIKVYQVKDFTQDSIFGTIWGYLLTVIHGDNGVLAEAAKPTVDPLLKTITWLSGVTMIIFRIIAIHRKNQKTIAEGKKTAAEAESQRIDNRIKLEKHNADLESKQRQDKEFYNLLADIRDHQEKGEDDLVEKKLDKLTKNTNMEHNLRLGLENRNNGN